MDNQKTKKNLVENYLNESTDLDRYEDVVFIQGEEAEEPLRILDDEGEEAALNYLKQWHNPGQHMGSAELGHGTSDKTFEKDGYIMSWNPRIGYIGLQYDLSKMNEETEEEGLTVSRSLAAKKSEPQRLDDPHRLKEEEMEEGIGIGLTNKKGMNKKPTNLYNTDVVVNEAEFIRKKIQQILLKEFKIIE